jgi:hypothetical protein
MGETEFQNNISEQIADSSLIQDDPGNIGLKIGELIDLESEEEKIEEENLVN